MFVNQENGQFYFGDMRVGDHEATPVEIATWEANYAKAEVDAKLTQVRVVREAMLNRITGIALAAQLTGDTATVDGFKTARQALLDITTGCPTDPALVDGFILNKYSAIVAGLPQTLINAFSGVDA